MTVSSARARVHAALTRLFDLLDEPVAEGLLDADPIGRADDILAHLRATLPDAPGPGTGRIAAAALELADARADLLRENATRTAVGVLRIQRALARLRTIGSTDGMLAAAPETLCETCGFEAAVLLRLDDGLVSVSAAHSIHDSEFGALVHDVEAGSPPVRIEELPLETRMLRRRDPILVTDATHDRRVRTDIAAALDVTTYVAAPIAPRDRVIGFLHATRSPEVDQLDRDLLWAFAEGYGYALERTILLERLQRQGTRIRDLVSSTEAALTEIGAAGLSISSTTADLVGAEHAPADAAFLHAQSFPLHSVLTRRELEVIELLAAGETNRRIAARLVVSPGTVKSHVSRILEKLGAANRAEAVSKYLGAT